MRVITGSARGMKLKELKGLDTRPTTDMVKESIFNIIQFSVEGRDALDLFAGTGQLGIEALSRGAASCVFIDSARDAVTVVRDNLAHTRLADRAEVRQTDYAAYLNNTPLKFDLIFLDPPYDESFLENSLKIINQIDILKPNGIIICESRKEKALPELAPPYFARGEYVYGKIKLTLYSRE